MSSDNIKSVETAAIVEVLQDENKDYKVTQQALTNKLPDGDEEGRHAIDWHFGPVVVKGFIYDDTFEMILRVSILGIDLGDIRGNIKDGIVINIELFSASGIVRFFLKNGNEIWTMLDIKVKFDGSFEGDYKLITL